MLGRVLLRDPVNRHHPLSRGLVSWWLTLPPLDGGARLYDIAGLNPGTLSGMGSNGGWRGTTRPGGLGQLLFDGSNDLIDTLGTVDTFAHIQNTGVFALGGWIAPDSSLSAEVAVIASTNTSNEKGFYISWNASNQKKLSMFAGRGSGGTVFLVTAPNNSLLADGWHHFLVSGNGSNVRVFVDGVFVATAAVGTLSSGSSTRLTNIGAFPRAAGPAGFFKGAADDVMLWSRGLSDAEARALYEESRLGLPTLLRRDQPNPTAALLAQFRRSNQLRAGSRGAYV